jgi:hypothetical protein
VFRPQSAASERRKLLQHLKLAVIATIGQTHDENAGRDLAAFTYQVLEDLAESVKATALAWEKRGYWVKADKFMAQWSWIENSCKQAAGAIERGDIQSQPLIAQKLAHHLEDIKLSYRLLNQEPWIGAWRGGADRGGDVER